MGATFFPLHTPHRLVVIRFTSPVWSTVITASCETCLPIQIVMNTIMITTNKSRHCQLVMRTILALRQCLDYYCSPLSPSERQL